MINWTPTGGELFTRVESATDILYTVVVESTREPQGFHAIITGFSVSPDELPPQVIISFVDDTLTVSATTLDGTYPMTVDFLQNKTYGQVDNFNALPPGKMDIYKYWKFAVPPRIFNLTVYSTDGDVFDNRTYQMIVTPDYSPGRDRLLAELDAREP